MIRECKRFLSQAIHLLIHLITIREYRFIKIEKGQYKGGKAMVMGNGPSLKLLLDKYHNGQIEVTQDSFFVNFAPLDDFFYEIKPKHYFISDYGFSREGVLTPQIKKMYDRLQREVDWDMNLYIARYTKKECQQLVDYSQINNPHIHFIFLYKRSCDELNTSWRNWLYKTGYFMPVEHTVVSTAIWTAILEGYTEIELYGVETNQFKDLIVNDENQVFLNDRHFYGERLLPVIGDNDGNPIKIHIFLGTITGMLRSHHILNLFAEYMGAKIYNCTPNSMIDSYPRRPCLYEKKQRPNDNISEIKNEKQ